MGSYLVLILLLFYLNTPLMSNKSKWFVPSGEVEALIRKICALKVSYPVVEMEHLIEIGESAVLPIIQVLDLVEGAPEPEDELPFPGNLRRNSFPGRGRHPV